MKKYVIIDKDLEATKYIKTIIASFDEMKFSGSSINQEEGLTLIFKNNPDIVFLDIDRTIENLPEFLLDICQYTKRQPAFIALSSSKEGAYTIFKYNFFDYLLKPLTELPLQRSALRYQKKHPSSICEKACPKSQKCKTICLKSNKDYQYLNTEEILFLKADNNTTDFHMKDGSIIGAYKTLKIFESTLPSNFLRIHKSYIINICYISRIHYGKSICIIKYPFCEIPFTKTFIKNIESMNKSLSNNAFVALN